EHLLQKLAEQAARYGGGRLHARDFSPDRWLEDGDEVPSGENTIGVLHCPGHTRGHVPYFPRPSRSAFVGDILFRHAIGAWEHGDGDLAQLVSSIREKLFALGD